MYAVIRTGGRQQKVEEGQRVQVDRLKESEGAELTLTPLMLVDGDDVLAGAGQLGRVTVSARVVGEVKAPKIVGFTYKNKSNQRKRWGHRQRYTEIEITGISRG